MVITKFKPTFRLINQFRKSEGLRGKPFSLIWWSGSYPGRREMSSSAVEKLVDSPEFQSVLTPELFTVATPLEKQGFDVRIVGGAVRDILLGIKPKDVDLGTNATPLEMIELFKKMNIHYIETGLQHGTLTVHVNKHNFEVTTLRIDAETDGRHAKVEFTNDWMVDAERRDLTINAMSLGLDGSLYDYFGGRDDLLKRRVRFVGDPKLRIQEDYLRILRYFRFYGRISSEEDNHDPTTLNVIQECAEGLKKIAVERIWIEISKILTGKYMPSLVRRMYDLNVAQFIGECLKPLFSTHQGCSIYSVEPLNNDVTREWEILITFLIMGFIMLVARLPESLFCLGHCSGGKMNFVISGMFKRLGGPVVCALDSRSRDPILDLQGSLCCGTRYLTLTRPWCINGYSQN